MDYTNTGPQAQPVSAPTPAPAPQAQGPWADYQTAAPASVAPTTPQGFTDEQKAQVLGYIPKAKSGSDLDAYARSISGGQIGINNGDEILKDYAATHRKAYGFSTDPMAYDTAPTPPGPSVADYGIHGEIGFRHNVGGTLGAPADLSNYILGNLDPSLHSDEPFLGSKQINHGLDSLWGMFGAGTPAPTTQGEVRAENIGGGIGAALLPELGLLKRGQLLVNGAVDLGKPILSQALDKLAMITAKHPTAALAAAAGGGTGAALGGEGGGDLADSVFPNSPTAHALGTFLGQTVGAQIGGSPWAIKPVADEAFLTRAETNPRAAYMRPVAQALADKAADVAPGGVFPKGRAKLTVEQINAVGNKPLAQVKYNIAQLRKTGELTPDQAGVYNQAIQNRAGITVPEINALRGNTVGDATADALMHYQTTKELTKPFGGSKPFGPLQALADAAISVGAAHYTGSPYGLAAGPVLTRSARYLSGKLFGPQDVNASRIRGADKAIANVPLFNQMEGRIAPPGTQFNLDNLTDLATAAKGRVAQSQAAQEAQAQMDALFKQRQQWANGLDALRAKAAPPPEEDLVGPAQAKIFQARQNFQQGVDDLRAKANPPPQDTPAAAPPTSNYDQGAPSAQPQPIPGPNVAPIRSQTKWNGGKAGNIAAADSLINNMRMDTAIPDVLKPDALAAAEYVKSGFGFKDPAHEWIENSYIPDLHIDGHSPAVIDKVRAYLHGVADRGKTHANRAAYERANGLTPSPPVAPTEPDDVPF